MENIFMIKIWKVFRILLPNAFFFLDFLWYFELMSSVLYVKFWFSITYPTLLKQNQKRKRFDIQWWKVFQIIWKKIFNSQFFIKIFQIPIIYIIFFINIIVYKSFFEHQQSINNTTFSFYLFIKSPSPKKILIPHKYTKIRLF